MWVRRKWAAVEISLSETATGDPQPRPHPPQDPTESELFVCPVHRFAERKMIFKNSANKIDVKKKAKNKKSMIPFYKFYINST